MAAMSDFLENKLLDFLFRGQALGITGATAAAGSGPTTFYVGLYTANPTDAAGGTEVTGNGYARVAVTGSLANWAGTQAAASTVASSGTGGTTSNNAAITFPTPTPAGWGTVTGFAIFDAATGGNMLVWSALTASKVINALDTVSFPAATLSFQIDN
jgi:hypothetical protein